MIFEKIKEFAVSECSLIDKEKPILAGVSGGADSLCLANSLHRAGYSLVIAHFNHQIRENAAQDAEFVEAWASNAGIPFVLGSFPVKEYAQREKLSLEEAARILRYQFLFEKAHYFDAQAVATGHTADDQVETVLMHFLRGAGLAGLKGMSARNQSHNWDAAIPLVRPLLSTWREETHRYCVENNLVPVEDITNYDPAYLRNRIRHELIPLLEDFNPRIREIIYRNDDVLKGEFDALSQIIDVLWDNHAETSPMGYVRLEYSSVKGLSPGLIRGILRKAMGILKPGLRDIDMRTVEEGQKFIAEGGRSGKINLSNGFSLLKEEDWIYLYTEKSVLPSSHWPQISHECLVPAPPIGTISLPGDWTLQMSEIKGKEISSAWQEARKNEDLFQVWLDADQVELPLKMRSRRDGDEWQPLGLESGNQKLSDFFINVKCPYRAREHWPLICSGKHIVWIPGYRLGHPYRITDRTTRIYYLIMKQIKQE
jgi:tRNA(Ile)-lysidine synthase